MASISRWLQEEGASNDLVQWAAPYRNNWADLWEGCPRGDWLLAIAVKLNVPPLKLAQAAGKCARLALLYIPEPEVLPGEALDLLDAVGRGEAEAVDCKKVIEQLSDLESRSAAPEAEAAIGAVVAALAALENPGAAAHGVSCVFQAAVFDAGDCGMMSALRFTQSRCADLVRDVVATAEILERAPDAEEPA